jgi:multicomponent Na+:H+ antiporter subunit G
MNTLLDIVTIVLILTGAFVALIAAVGVVLLRDARSAMHAATKPATLSVLLIGAGTVLQLDNVSTVSKLVVIVVLQFVTAPVGAHMLARGITSDTDSSDDHYD